MSIEVFQPGFGSGQSVRDVVQSVVDSGQIPSCVFTQVHPMGHFTLEGQHIIPAKVLQGQGHLEATVSADGNRVQTCGVLHGVQQGGAGVFFVSEDVSTYYHSRKTILRVWVFGQGFHVCLEPGNKALALLNLRREGFEQIILQSILLALMIGLHQLQPGHIHVQVHLFLDTLIAGA